MCCSCVGGLSIVSLCPRHLDVTGAMAEAFQGVVVRAGGLARLEVRDMHGACRVGGPRHALLDIGLNMFCLKRIGLPRPLSICSRRFGGRMKSILTQGLLFKGVVVGVVDVVVKCVVLLLLLLLL